MTRVLENINDYHSEGQKQNRSTYFNVGSILISSFGTTVRIELPGKKVELCLLIIELVRANRLQGCL